MNDGPEVVIEDLGLVAYEEARSIQIERLQARIEGRRPDTLLLLEHPHVVTLGRGTHPDNIHPDCPYPRIPVERGGDVTLHLPGQIVGYLIRRLPEGERDLHRHLRLLEEILIRTLAAFGIEGGRIPGKTGVWCGERKIASLGVACRRWCTWHGWALNVRNPLEPFAFINPCGFDAGVMTSMERELGRAPDPAAVKGVLARETQALVTGGTRRSGSNPSAGRPRTQEPDVPEGPVPCETPTGSDNH